MVPSSLIVIVMVLRLVWISWYLGLVMVFLGILGVNGYFLSMVIVGRIEDFVKCAIVTSYFLV